MHDHPSRPGAVRGSIALAPEDPVTSTSFISYYIGGSPPPDVPQPADIFNYAIVCGTLRVRPGGTAFVAALEDLAWGDHFVARGPDDRVQYIRRFQFRGRHPLLDGTITTSQVISNPSEFAGRPIRVRGLMLARHKPTSSDPSLLMADVTDVGRRTSCLSLEDQDGSLPRLLRCNSMMVRMPNVEPDEFAQAILEGVVRAESPFGDAATLGSLSEICLSTSNETEPLAFACYDPATAFTEGVPRPEEYYDVIR